MYHTSEAITLRSIPYKDNSFIVTFFTEEEGIISLLLRGSAKKKSHIMALSSVFCLSEITYIHTKGEICSFVDASIISSQLNLRKDLPTLRSASCMTKSILSSQQPHKKAKKLYLLYKGYLQKITSFSSPEILSSSFFLKLLLYEGMLKLHPTCNICSNPTSCIDIGESLCSSHKKNQGINISEDELTSLLLLTYSKKFSDIENVEISTTLNEKIKQIFEIICR